MNLKQLFRIGKKLAPIAITYGPVIIAAFKDAKREVKATKPGSDKPR